MDSNHLSALLLHNENEAKPKCVPLEHWTPNEDGKHPILHKGYMFCESMDYDEFMSKILLPLNNHMKKKELNTPAQMLKRKKKTNMAKWFLRNM